MAARSAIRTSRDSLHEQELKRITIPAATTIELQNLASRALIPSVVRDDAPKSTQVVAQMLKRLKECLHQQKNEVIYELSISGNNSILDVRITNLDAPSKIHRKPETFLHSHECEKEKHLEACLSTNARQFSPFVVSCDGELENLAGSLAKKSGNQEVKDEDCTSHTFVQHLRITHPACRMDQPPQWDDAAGILLVQP